MTPQEHITEELLPCPFCGDALTRCEVDTWKHVGPKQCIADGIIVQTREELRAWNTRITTKGDTGDA